jgi:hypothetical protein
MGIYPKYSRNIEQEDRSTDANILFLKKGEKTQW